MSEQQPSGPTAPPVPSMRTAYGVRSAVERAQSVVPDEPVEAVLIVRRRWVALLIPLSVVLAINVSDWVRGATRHRTLGMVVGLLVVVPLILGAVWLLDRSSSLRIGIGGAYLAVTPTRVLVVTPSPWRPRRVRVALELERATLPVTAVEDVSWLRTVGVRLPSRRIVLLRVFQGQRAAHLSALPIVVGPPGSCWGQRDDDPTWMARLWTPAGWSDVTIPLRDLDLARVQLAPLPQPPA